MSGRRVLLVCEPPDGGAAEQTVTLAERLPEHGWTVEVAAPAGSRRADRIVAAGARLHELALAPGYGNPTRDAKAIRALTTLLRQSDFDLVHLHSAKAGVLGRLAARAAGVPAVFTPHSWSFVGDFSARRRRVAVTIERALAPLAAAVICVCEDERAQGEAQRVKPRRSVVIHNGVEACDAAVEPDPTLVELAGDGRLVLCLSGLRPQKSVDVFLEAVPRIFEADPTARAAVVGDGELRDALHVQARSLGLLADPRFAFMDFQAPAARYLKAADVYVLPSSWEAFPIGVLEALACGVPQVATDVGGTREAVVDETGLLVPPRRPDVLARAVGGLLADAPRREHLAQASRARHAARFTTAQMIAATANLYDEVTS
jgi:glycosyltransferase involved in cell wall biosynthesis